MPDELDYDDLDEEQPEDDDLVRKLRSAQRNAKKEAKALREQAEEGKTAKRELVKLQAGLPDNKMTKLFLDTYDGELTKDAVIAAAREYDLIGPDPQDTERQEQVGQVDTMMRTHDGGTPPAAPGTNDAVLEQIRNVKTLGDDGAYEIARILKANGLFRDDE